MSLAGAGLIWAAVSAGSVQSECNIAAFANVPNVRIEQAVQVSNGFSPPFPDAKPIASRFCRIVGVIEKEIGFELWLPLRGDWNGRLLVGGVGGQAGALNYREMARGVARGYASASSDSGHKASDKHWLLGRPDRAQNYAHRANHQLTVKAKLLIGRAYGRMASHAFFIGCSGGGRQALTEVQRYPTDFDGVIAGAPGVNTPAMSARRMWEMQQHSRWGDAVPPAVWQMVYRKALSDCGDKYGVVPDPRQCGFRPVQLLCKPGQTDQCLNAVQVAAVDQLFAPLHDENGRKVDDGLLPTVPVSPAPLPEPYTPGPSYLATVLFGDGVHADPLWDARQFSLARDLPAIDKVMNLHADDPAIHRFVRRGGKLILYQGWDDPLVAAGPTIDYFAALRSRFGTTLNRAARLYMVPGMDHCRGGPGADQFGGAGGDGPSLDPQHDLLSALEKWVLEGKAPQRIVASKVEGGRVVRTRLLCPYPATHCKKG